MLPASPPSPLPLHLIDEISHRVCNEYAEAVATLAEAATAIRSAADRLCSQAHAHRVLQSPLAQGPIDVGEYIAPICRQLATSPAVGSANLTVITDDTVLDAGRCWRIGLAVAELVRNAPHHGLRGGPGEIRIELTEAGEWVCCSVSNAGDAALGRSTGRGRPIVEALASDLGGLVRWSLSSEGCRVCLTFPRLQARTSDPAGRPHPLLVGDASRRQPAT